VDFGENGVDFGGYLDRYVDRGSEKSKAGLRSIHEWFCSFFPFAIICGGFSPKSTKKLPKSTPLWWIFGEFGGPSVRSLWAWEFWSISASF
jgi:hypothetical protein